MHDFFHCILSHLFIKQKSRQIRQKSWLGDLFHLIDDQQTQPATLFYNNDFNKSFRLHIAKQQVLSAAP